MATSSTLTADDVRRLTLFKWHYTLTSAGFTAEQARGLLFVKWLVAHRDIERTIREG